MAEGEEQGSQLVEVGKWTGEWVGGTAVQVVGELVEVGPDTGQRREGLAVDLWDYDHGPSKGGFADVPGQGTPSLLCGRSQGRPLSRVDVEQEADGPAPEDIKPGAAAFTGCLLQNGAPWSAAGGGALAPTPRFCAGFGIAQNTACTPV